MATGALGAAGGCAVGPAVEGRCDGTARVTIPGRPMEGEAVRVQIPRSRGATLTCVLVSLFLSVHGMSEPLHLVILAGTLPLAHQEYPRQRL